MESNKSSVYRKRRGESASFKTALRETARVVEVKTFGYRKALAGINECMAASGPQRVG